MADPDLQRSIDNLVTSLAHVHKMTHSGVVLTGAAILDLQLERSLKKAMKPLPKKLYARLFEGFGPLSSFASKIIMARALGVITVDHYIELEKIRDIRNTFAHASKILDFTSKEIGPKFLNLKKPMTSKTNPIEVFVDCVGVVVKFLDEYLAEQTSK